MKWVPISSQEIRRAICGSDAGYKGYLLKILSHDLLKDRDGCVRILEMTGSFIDDKELSSGTENAIKENDLNWVGIASKIGQELMDKIKDKR